MQVSTTIERFAHADGTSHARALAYQSAFVLMSGFIGTIGLAGALEWELLRATVVELASRVAPGSSGRLLQQAIEQGASGGPGTAVIGLGAALTAGTLAMAQLERAANRMHGVTRDRPPVARYGLALAMTLTAGVMLAIGGLLIGAGRSIAIGAGLSGEAATVWEVARWPAGLALAGLAIAIVDRTLCPGRPDARTVTIATGLSLALWAVFTAALGVYLSISSGSSNPYGPLLAVIAMLLWSAATSLALHLGLALIAERRTSPASTAGRVDIPDTPSVSRAAR